MLKPKRRRSPPVRGAERDRALLAELPPPENAHWTSRRKAAVVAAIDDGLLTIIEARIRYRLSDEELASWRRTLDRAGLPGLRATKAKQYRDQAGL